MVILSTTNKELIELTHEIDWGCPVSYSREHLRACSNVCASSPTVGVTAQTNSFRVSVSKFDNLSDCSFYTLQHITVRTANPEVDIGLHQQVPITHVTGKVGLMSIRRSRMYVEILRVLLIEPHYHRKLLSFLIVVRDRKRTL